MTTLEKNPFAAIELAGDDKVVPFEVSPLDIRGRAVQLGPMLDAILARHDYPASVATLLGEAVVLTVLLGTSLKFEGKFILQTQTDGPVSLLVADFRTPDSVRAYARYDAQAVETAIAEGRASPEALLGGDHAARGERHLAGLLLLHDVRQLVGHRRRVRARVREGDDVVRGCGVGAEGSQRIRLAGVRLDVSEVAAERLLHVRSVRHLDGLGARLYRWSGIAVRGC